MGSFLTSLDEDEGPAAAEEEDATGAVLEDKDDAEAIAADMARICSGGSPLWIEVGGVKGECGRQNMDKVRGGAEILARLPKMH